MSEPQTKLQKYSAPALEKGLDILEFLSLTDIQPSLSQLAAAIGRSKSEIFRMMIVLEERGFIQRFDGDVYGLTDRLALLGGERSDNGKLAEIAMPYLESLSDRTKLSSHFCVGVEDSLMVIASTSTAQNYALNVLVGSKTNLFGTAAGACILSRISDLAQRDDILSRTGTDFDANARSAFSECVRACDSEGFAELPSPEAHAILEMSAPVQHLPGDVTIGAVTVSTFGSAVMDNRKGMVVQVLLETVQELQHKIAITMPKPRAGDVLI